MGRLHQMNMMGPRARRSLAEEQLAGKPRHVLRHVMIAERPDRLDPSLGRLLKAWHANQQVDDRLGRQARDRRAADVLDGQSERAEHVLDRSTFLLEPDRPVGIIVADDDRPGPVFLHANAPDCISWQGITQVAAETSRLGYRLREKFQGYRRLSS